jgi:hypothetical protein
MVMMDLIIFNPSDIGDMFRAKLEVDADPLAERIIILDRATSTLINVMFASGFIILPAEFATTKLLTILMLDDNLEYNGVVLDGVTCELVNATLTEPSWIAI